MYDVLIIEDDAEQARHLANLVGDSPASERLRVLDLPFGDVGSALEALPGADIVLADVQLESPQTGIDVIAERLDPGSDTQVIYVSGHVEFAPDAYRTPHTWFLAKPVDPAALSQALDRALGNLAERGMQPFIVRSGGALVQVVPSRVLYIESARRKLVIHERDRVVETYAKISDIEGRLISRFARCHKSFLVNMSYIAELGAHRIRLANGEEIPVSQRCAHEVRDRFVEFVSRSI